MDRGKGLERLPESFQKQQRDDPKGSSDIVRHSHEYEDAGSSSNAKKTKDAVSPVDTRLPKSVRFQDVRLPEAILQPVPPAHTRPSRRIWFRDLPRSSGRQDQGIELVPLDPNESKKKLLEKLASPSYHDTAHSLEKLKKDEFVNPRLELDRTMKDMDKRIQSTIGYRDSILRKFSSGPIGTGENTQDARHYVENTADPMIRDAQAYLENARQQASKVDISHKDLLKLTSGLREKASSLSHVHALWRTFVDEQSFKDRQERFREQADQRAGTEWSRLQKGAAYIAFAIPAGLIGTPVSTLWERPKEPTSQDLRRSLESAQRIPLRHALDLLSDARSTSQKNIDKIAVFCKENAEELLGSTFIEHSELKMLARTVEQMKIVMDEVRRDDSVHVNKITMSPQDVLTKVKDLSKKNAKLTEHWIRLHQAISHPEEYDVTSIKVARSMLGERISTVDEWLRRSEKRHKDTMVSKEMLDAESSAKRSVREARNMFLREETTVSALKKQIVKMMFHRDRLAELF